MRLQFFTKIFGLCVIPSVKAHLTDGGDTVVLQHDCGVDYSPHAVSNGSLYPGDPGEIIDQSTGQ